MQKVRAAKVPVGEAAEVIPRMRSAGMIDLSSRISGDGEYRFVPLVPGREADAEAMGFLLTEIPSRSEGSLSPLEKVRDSLTGLDLGLLALLPDKWEIAGRTVTMKVDPTLSPVMGDVGRAYAEALGVSAVYADVSGVHDELRIPDVRLIWGEACPAEKTESGITYTWDPSCIMFASGNLVERARMGRTDCTGETVVDMFAGIGYFTLPIARFAGARKVFACEKNPVSYGYLVRNIELNSVGDKVIPILADNRSLCGKGFADRIMMGYVQRTSEFIPKALSMAKPGCIIHYHDTFMVGTERSETERVFSKHAGKDGFEILSIREVKSFAPNVSHYVADVRV